MRISYCQQHIQTTGAARPKCYQSLFRIPLRILLSAFFDVMLSQKTRIFVYELMRNSDLKQSWFPVLLNAVLSPLTVRAEWKLFAVDIPRGPSLGTA